MNLTSERLFLCVTQKDMSAHNQIEIKLYLSQTVGYIQLTNGDFTL